MLVTVPAATDIRQAIAERRVKAVVPKIIADCRNEKQSSFVDKESKKPEVLIADTMHYE